MSASNTPTRCPAPDKAWARLIATVDLPTPPLQLQWNVRNRTANQATRPTHSTRTRKAHPHSHNVHHATTTTRHAIAPQTRSSPESTYLWYPQLSARKDGPTPTPRPQTISCVITITARLGTKKNPSCHHTWTQPGHGRRLSNHPSASPNPGYYKGDIDPTQPLPFF